MPPTFIFFISLKRSKVTLSIRGDGRSTPLNNGTLPEEAPGQTGTHAPNEKSARVPGAAQYVTVNSRSWGFVLEPAVAPPDRASPELDDGPPVQPAGTHQNEPVAEVCLGQSGRRAVLGTSGLAVSGDWTT
jgi:hypothetical protein